MEQMTIKEIERILIEDNPKSPLVTIKVYSLTFITYFEAADNVKKNGAIVLHPRTGAPIENPYLKIMNQQQAILLKNRQVKADRLFNKITQ